MRDGTRERGFGGAGAQGWSHPGLVPLGTGAVRMELGLPLAVLGCTWPTAWSGQASACRVGDYLHRRVMGEDTEASLALPCSPCVVPGSEAIREEKERKANEPHSARLLPTPDLR